MKPLVRAADVVLYVDKPLGWTSFDVVKRLRGLLRVRKIGHAGTLDPLATGLLILCTDAACKRVTYFQQMPKTYEGLLRLGECRPSHDLETQVSHRATLRAELSTALAPAVQRYIGTISQRPPDFSAIKIQGRRAYTYARKQATPPLHARPVTVHTFELLRIDLPWVRFRMRVSKGTYVRSLVRDLGQDLGVGAALHMLRRTAIGDIDLSQAHSMAEMAAWAKPPRL